MTARGMSRRNASHARWALRELNRWLAEAHSQQIDQWSADGAKGEPPAAPHKRRRYGRTNYPTRHYPQPHKETPNA